VQRFDASGDPTTDAPAFVRFSQVVGHFSTWAVVVVSAPTGAMTTTTTLIIADDPDPSVVGAAVSVQWSVTVNGGSTGTPTGVVTVGDGVDSCSAAVSVGTCALALTTAGARTLTATYSGDTIFAGSAGTTPHTVTYAFAGFFSPVENQPLVNEARAGQAIPLKWAITDAGGAGIADPTSFIGVTSYATDCREVEGSPASVVEEYTADDSGLVSLGDGRWQFDWKTPRSYAGQCRVLTLSLQGSTHHAVVRFR
jgi:hypothetical protein